MKKELERKDISLGMSLIGYSIFIISIIIITYFENPYLRSFSLITFFFVPGLLLMQSIKPTKIHYTPIELMIISFGLSLILIIMITYFLIIIDKFAFINLVYIILTTISFTFLVFKYKCIKIDNLSNNSDDSFTKKIYLLIKNDKESFVILILIFIFFFFGFFFKRYNIFRFPDEYLYLWASDQSVFPNLMRGENILQDYHIIFFSFNKIGFILTLSFYYTLAGTALGFVPHILSIMFYSLLIPVTYLLGSLHNKKTGIIAALFIASNPVIWFWNNRVMPDIPYTIITTACFYFFFKAFKKRGKINIDYLIPAVLFIFLSYTQQPKILFVWAVPFVIYFFSSFIRRDKNDKLLIYIFIFSILGFFLLIIVLLFIAPWFFNFNLVHIFDQLFSVFGFSNEDWINLLSPGGTFWNCIGFPYYFSHVIIILFIVGTVYFTIKHSKRESALFILSIVSTVYFHILVFSGWDTRFSFIIFPLLMVLAAIGFSANLRYYSLFLIPFLFYLFPILPVYEPGVAISPPMTDWIGILSRLIGFLFIVYKIFEGILSKHISFVSKSIQRLKIPSSFFILIIISSSFIIGNTFATNQLYIRNETITPEELGLPQAGDWILKNVPSNSVIITNCRAHTLNFFTKSSFNSEGFFRRNDEEIGWITTPSNEDELNNIIFKNDYDYMIVFTKYVVGEPWLRPFFQPYIKNDRLFTVYEKSVVSNSSFNSWGVAKGNINFSIDYIEKMQGLYSIKLNGSTDEIGRTRINYYFDEPLNLENTSSLFFWFKLNAVVNISDTYLFLVDNDGNYRLWKDIDFFNYSYNWKKIEFFMNSFYEQDGPFKVNNVTRTSIYIYAAPNSSISYNLDNFIGFSDLKLVEL